MTLGAFPVHCPLLFPKKTRIRRKLVVKQEMGRVNTDILGICELKWTGMGEFNSGDRMPTTVGKNPLEETE